MVIGRFFCEFTGVHLFDEVIDDDAATAAAMMLL